MEQTGYIHGQHYSAYVSQIQALKEANQDSQLEQLLLTICDATEEEARVGDFAPAPAYYKELAILYRKQKLAEKEQRILERYLQHAKKQAKPELVERLAKVKKGIQKKR